MHDHFEGFFLIVLLATTKIAAEMPPNLKLSAAIFCLREFIQIARTGAMLTGRTQGVNLRSFC